MEEKQIRCFQIDEKWLCTADDKTRKVTFVDAPCTRLYGYMIAIDIEPDCECRFLIDKHGDRELICRTPEELERFKRAMKMTEEKE